MTTVRSCCCASPDCAKNGCGLNRREPPIHNPFMPQVSMEEIIRELVMKEMAKYHFAQEKLHG